MISIRPATAGDQAAIKWLVRTGSINPMGIRWPSFLVAVDDATQTVVGIGQVKQHGDGSRELASIATAPEQRGRGIASRLIESLLEREAGELYLTCRKAMGPFYTRFGFSEVGLTDMPPYFRRLRRLANVFLALSNRDNLLIMRRPPGG